MEMKELESDPSKYFRFIFQIHFLKCITVLMTILFSSPLFSNIMFEFFFSVIDIFLFLFILVCFLAQACTYIMYLRIALNTGNSASVVQCWENTLEIFSTLDFGWTFEGKIDQLMRVL